MANCQFLGLTGTFSSYGFDSSQMIIGQNYAYCIRFDLIYTLVLSKYFTPHYYFTRPAAGYCCIEYTPVTWSVFSGSILATTCTDPGSTNELSCAGAANCNMNFIVVPGVLSPQTCKADGTECHGLVNGRDR